MAITERLMAPGNFTVSFSQEFTPTAIIESIKEWGHIVVTPQEIDVDTLNDSDILNASRYTGIVLNRTLEEGTVTVSGQGLELYMGDGSGKGMVIAESNNIGKVRTYTDATLSETLFNSVVSDGKPFGIMRDEAGNLQAIQQGTISNPATLYTGQHFVETALSALKFVSEILNTEYRVNPNGTIDAGPSANLFVGVGTNEPTSVVVKSAYGEDPEYEGVTPQGLRSEFDATDWVSRVDFTGEVGYFNIPTDVAGEANLSSIPYKDLHGNDLKRVGLVQEPEAPEEHLNTRAQSMLNELSRVKKILNLDLTQYEVSGDMKVGDFVYAFDPDVGFVDTDEDASAESRDKYEVTFRGQTITPAKVRVTGLTFPIMSGMGVYFRDKDGNYTDLTEYVQFESGSTQVELGDVLRSIRDDLRFNEFSLSRQNAGVFSIPDLPATPTLQSGTYLDSTGDSKGFIRVTFNRPLNEDGSQITDGSHYKVRYKKITDNEYSFMNFPYTNASSETLIIQDLTVGVSYQIGVATVDRSGFKKMSSYDGAGEDLYTDSASVNANFASNAVIEIEKDCQAPSKPKQAQSIAAGPLRVQVTHYLGKDGLDGQGNPFGDFTLEGDLDHLDVHAVAQSGNVQDFTVAESNKIGEVRVTSGNLLQGIPVVGTMELEDSQDYYFRIVAVDKSGNESDPSDGQSAVANLIVEANIADANITNIKIATAAITDAKIADATITDAKISDLSAGKITSGSIIGGEITVGGIANTSGFIKSYNFSSGSAGWAINADGSAEFDAAVIRGTLDASQINVTNLDATNITAGTLSMNRLDLAQILTVGEAADDVNSGSTTIDGGNITTGTITSTQISANTITTNELNFTPFADGDDLTAGTVGGINISSTAIESSNYASSGGADGFRIQSDGDAFFRDVTISGTLNGVVANQPVTLDISSGGKIRTASSGARVELHQQGNFPSVNFYSSGSPIVTSLYDDNSASFVISTTREISLNGAGGIHLGDDTLHIGDKTGNLLTAIYIDGDKGGSTDVVRSTGNYAYWGSAPSSSGVTAAQGQGTISVGPNNTGSIIISNNHSHDASQAVNAANNNSFNAAVNHINHNVHSHNNTNLTNLGNNNVITTGNQNNNHKHDNSAHNQNYGFSNLILGNNTGTAANATHVHGYNTSNEANTNNIASFTKNYANSAANSRVVQHEFTYSHSDERLKTDVTSTTLGLDFINKLNPVDFYWTEDYLDAQWVTDEDNNQINPNTNTIIEKDKLQASNTRQGFIAQEVKAAVYDETGSNNAFSGVYFGDYIDYDSTVTNGADDMGRVDYQAFVPVLVKAVQQLSAKIDVLEARIDELEGA